ncbi:MAG TPA: glycosyltransferase [Planctomycetota bacterium]|nr:glycosyltransferase [Planctomycetota bacterium]
MKSSAVDAKAPQPVRSALAIDVCEWFHDPALAEHLARRHWRRLPSRLPQAVSLALEWCARRGAKATFFVFGSFAERCPELVRRIAAAGHEVASAGHEPLQLDAVAELDRPAVLQAWRRAREQIEAATGRRVRGFRSMWPARGEPWWRAELEQQGYAYDATARGEPGDDSGLRVVEVHSLAGARAVALGCSAWQFDDAPAERAFLPRAIVRKQLDEAARVRTALADSRAASVRLSTATSIADLLGLPDAAPPEAAAASPPAPSVPFVPRSDVPRLAIVVPLKDEEQGVPSLVAELDALAEHLRDRAACEFVFVDDGSTDRTAALLEELVAARPHARLARPHARLVRHAHNQGVAAAIRTGIQATDAPLVASIDGDLSYDPIELEHMLPLLEGADVVTASPYHRDGGVRHVPGWRLLLSRTLSKAYRLLLRSDLCTWTSCFRLYRRCAVVDLPLDNPGFLGTAELLVRVLRAGGVVREHPCVLEARLLGVSKMRVLRTIRGHVRLLWQVWRRQVS